MAASVATFFVSSCKFAKLGLASASDFRIVINALAHGDIAQLGERVTGSHEVRGSNPLISTTYDKAEAHRLCLFSYQRAYGATGSAGDS